MKNITILLLIILSPFGLANALSNTLIKSQNISSLIELIEFNNPKVSNQDSDLVRLLDDINKPETTFKKIFGSSVKAYPEADMLWLSLDLSTAFNAPSNNSKKPLDTSWSLNFNRMRGDQRLRLFQLIDNGHQSPYLQELSEENNGRDSVFEIKNLTYPQFYIRAYDVQKRYNFPVFLMDQEQLIRDRLFNLAIIFCIIGFILALALYNLSVYIRTQKTAYLYYVLYLFSTVFVVTLLENLEVLIFQKNGLWLTITPQISTAFAGLFFISFLNTKTFTPKLHFILVIATALAFILPLSYLMFEITVLVTLRTINFFLVFLPAFLAGMIRLKQGFSPAKYILMGWPLPIIGGSILMIMSAGMLPYSVYIGHLYYLGVMIEIILFALALADQINLLEREKKILIADKLVASQQNNQLKDQFLSTISHELRTPLNGATAALELLKERYQDSTELKLAQQSTRHLTRLINKILIFNEIHADQLSSNIKALNLSPLLLEKLVYFKNEADSKKLSMTWEINLDQDAYFECDGELISLINSELLQNAVNFTHTGNIHIHCEFIDTQAAQTFHFKITDTGKGLSTDQLDSAFNYFEQIDQSFTRDVDGIGLGLTLVNTLVKHLDGQLKVDSELGKGSCFEYFIPMKRLQSENNSEKENVLFGHNKQVLIVEDQKTNQIILDKFLQKFGFATDIAKNGQIAVDYCQKTHYELIFMDLQMPVLDGFSASEKILQKGLNINTPIVVVSANTNSVEVQRCRKIGINAFISKPINLTVIKEECLKQLGK